MKKLSKNILHQFTGEHTIRIELTKIHSEQGWHYACNGHILIRGKAENTDVDVPEVQGYPNVHDLMQENVDKSKKTDPEDIRISSLKSVIERVPMDPEFDEETCPECEGAGEIETECWECESLHYENCEKCNNKGYIETDKKIGETYRPHHHIKILGKYFNPAYIEKVIDVGLQQEVDVVQWYSIQSDGDTTPPDIIKAGCGEILFMPIHVNGTDIQSGRKNIYELSEHAPQSCSIQSP